LIGRGLRAFVDGYVAVLLPAYLLALGHATWQVGLLSTATLLGSALATLALGAWGHHAAPRFLLLAAALLMAATGLGFAGLSAFWPLLLVAFVGTLNPSSGDVSVFLPLEHSRLSHAAEGDARTRLFARYSLTGALCASLGALAAAVPDALAEQGIDRLTALRGMFLGYAGVGALLWLLYARLPQEPVREQAVVPTPLGPSRGTVVKLAALFSVDAFAGGLVVNSLLALWLFERFGLLAVFRDQPAGCPVATGCAVDGQAHRLAQYHGVHSHSVQPVPDSRGPCSRFAYCRGTVVAAFGAVANGRADTLGLCHGGGDAVRAGSSGELYSRAAQSGCGAQSDTGRGAVGCGLAGRSAGSLRLPQDRL
jgi:MFS family permease